MRQAAADGGVFFQRENLRFLLQAADGGGVDDTATIAFKLPHHIVLITRLNGRTERTLKIEFRFKIDPGHEFPPFQPLTRPAEANSASQTHYLLPLAMIDYRAL